MAHHYQPPFLLLFLLFSVHLAVSSFQQRPKISGVDLAALSLIKDSLTDIPGSRFFSTWDFSSPDPCSSFTGVTCGSVGRVTILSLGTGLSGSPGLAGSLSPALSNLTQLTQLILFPGLVTGPIPQLCQLTGLRVISLTNNRLTGPGPSHRSHKASIFKSPGAEFERINGRVTRNNVGAVITLGFEEEQDQGTVARAAVNRPLLVGIGELDVGSTQLPGFTIRVNVPRRGPPSPILRRRGIHRRPEPQLHHGEITPWLAGVETLFLNNNRLMGSVPEEYIKSVYDGTTTTLYLQHNYLSGFPLPRGYTCLIRSLCLAYNCMEPQIGISACPVSAGRQPSRPQSQCSVFSHRGSSD
ncbi:Detected protein of unknown function [Hibiscus syriacus]|uniref:Leucine-rich repeat-containing N-terminal plant-type domain-containing protein n=1 Tax=Hibiscus syriacus TaxID=106335 RepID=A0A6A2WFW3_HIBSY|nr:Detected protein of unknown function [Hibiscus syriacus]